MSINPSALSRRSFVAGSVLTAASVAATAQMPVMAKADEPVAPSASWLGEAPEVGEPVQTVEADVVVVGAGTGGWFASCSAAEEGVKVVLLEKTEGGANVRGDLGAVNSRYQLEDGCAIDEQGILFDLLPLLERQQLVRAAPHVVPELRCHGGLVRRPSCRAWRGAVA